MERWLPSHGGDPLELLVVLSPSTSRLWSPCGPCLSLSSWVLIPLITNLNEMLCEIPRCCLLVRSFCLRIAGICQQKQSKEQIQTGRAGGSFGYSLEEQQIQTGTFLYIFASLSFVEVPGPIAVARPLPPRHQESGYGWSWFCVEPLHFYFIAARLMKASINTQRQFIYYKW